MIRPALHSDIAAIAAIWNPIIRDTLVTFNPTEKTAADIAQTLEARAGAGQPFVVATDAGGTVLGFATYFQFRGGLGYARTMEHTILLAPSAWGRGLGRALMSTIEGHARMAGMASLIGGVSGSNPPGIAFHAALGYEVVGRVPRAGFKFGQFHDLVLMQKLL